MDIKYLTTAKDILKLKNTNKKIYSRCYRIDEGEYMQFIDGVLCGFSKDGDASVNISLDIDEDPYIVKSKWILKGE